MEQYARILKLINEATLKKIQDKNIVIVGIGGVGGFALEDAKDAVNNEDASNEVGDVEQHALQAG